MQRFLTTEAAGEIVAHQINPGVGTVVFLTTEQAEVELAAGTVEFENPDMQAAHEAAVAELRERERQVAEAKALLDGEAAAKAAEAEPKAKK